MLHEGSGQCPSQMKEGRGDCVLFSIPRHHDSKYRTPESTRCQQIICEWQISIFVNESGDLHYLFLCVPSPELVETTIVDVLDVFRIHGHILKHLRSEPTMLVAYPENKGRNTLPYFSIVSSGRPSWHCTLHTAPKTHQTCTHALDLRGVGRECRGSRAAFP